MDDEPVTVSYNTKVFNKEIMALRMEEEALLRYQNAARKREYRVDQLKYKPSMLDYNTLSSQKAGPPSKTLSQRKPTIQPRNLSSNVNNNSLETLNVGLDLPTMKQQLAIRSK